MRIAGLSLTFVSLPACISLSQSDETVLRELRSQGVREDVQKKDAVTAGVLNVLPGFGNFYLAVGTDEGSQWLFGFLNLLLWPISPIWGIPEAAIDANTINKKETVYYYTYDANGKAELAKIRARQ